MPGRQVHIKILEGFVGGGSSRNGKSLTPICSIRRPICVAKCPPNSLSNQPAKSSSAAGGFCNLCWGPEHRLCGRQVLWRTMRSASSGTAASRAHGTRRAPASRPAARTATWSSGTRVHTGCDSSHSASHEKKTFQDKYRQHTHMPIGGHTA